MLRRTLGLVVVLLAGCSTGSRTVAMERSPDPVTNTRSTETTAAADDGSAVASASGAATPAAEGSTPDAAPAPRVAPAEPVTPAIAAPDPAVAVASIGRAEPWTVEPYRGFGAWLDAFDWSASFARSPEHVIGPEHIDHMASEGVQTIYIQASRWNSPTDILEPERLQMIIDRSHAHGMSVVAWYLPTLVDPATDIRRILAIAAMDFDGIGIDIESRDVKDVAERNRRLIELSKWIRAELPGKTISAIPLEPVLMEDVNPNYWPGFPWAAIAPYYDVWMPMSYWTNRRAEWRDAYRYTAVNIARIRERIGQPDALVHTIGGIGDKTTVQDLQGMVTAAVDQRAIGGSIYDYRTSHATFWETLRAFRSV